MISGGTDDECIKKQRSRRLLDALPTGNKAGRQALRSPASAVAHE
jgi:hypothetical protein